MNRGAAAKQEGDASPDVEMRERRSGGAGDSVGSVAAGSGPGRRDVGGEGGARPGSGGEPANAAGGGRGSSGAPDIDLEVEGAPPVLADLDFIRALIAAVDSSGIDSLDLTVAGGRVKLSKTPRSQPFAAPPPHGYGLPVPVVPGGYAPGAAPPAAAAPTAPAAGTEQATGGAAPASKEPEPADTLADIVSPMVGTFYRAPAPEAPPYVEVGSRISKGQTLCILEAMKLMNELTSEIDGVVREILVENSEPVEYGQVLFRIEPS